MKCKNLDPHFVWRSLDPTLGNWSDFVKKKKHLTSFCKKKRRNFNTDASLLLHLSARSSQTHKWWPSYTTNLLLNIFKKCQKNRNTSIVLSISYFQLFRKNLWILWVMTYHFQKSYEWQKCFKFFWKRVDSSVFVACLFTFLPTTSVKINS